MTRAKPKKLYASLHVQVLVGFAGGIAVGYFWPDAGVKLKPFADGFINLIKMMIAPVVFCTITSGINSVGNQRKIGGTLLRAMGLFYALTVVALLSGLAFIYLFHPGVGLNIDPASLDKSVAAQFTAKIRSAGVVEFILGIIPSTMVGAFTGGEVLPVLLVAILVGFGIMSVGPRGAPILQGIESVSSVLFAIFGFVVRLAPLGAFGAMANTVGKWGIGSLIRLGWFIGTFYVAGLFFVFVVLGLVAYFHRFSLWKLIRYIREEFLIVLGTSSMEPVLARLLHKLEKLGCDKGVVGFVLPAGYSFNLDGTAIYLSLATVFITQALNIDLSASQTIGMLVLMLLTSKGAAGVTGSGFVALVATLTVMPEIPVDGVAIIFGVDRFMSLGRALVSCASNAVAVIVISKWEGACDRDVLRRELDGAPAPAEMRISSQ